MFNIKNIEIPKQPGCYIMKDKDNIIIYIGKAKVLQNRVRSYFRGAHDNKTTVLVQNIANIEFIITDTEIEALLLEARLIHKHKPKFNIDLKDTIRYAYIKITNEEFPRIISTRNIDRKKDIFFGPYPDGAARKRTVHLLNKTFGLRTCKKMPKHVCLLFHIGQCNAPCESKVTKQEYKKHLTHAISILKGNVNKVIKTLTNEMNKYSENQEYELAKNRRDQIYSLRHIGEKQKISLNKTFNQDYINYRLVNDNVYIHLFNVQKGILSGRKQFDFPSNKGNMSEFLRQYYFSNEIPEEIVLPKLLKDQVLLEEYFTKIKGRKVKITIPTKGTKKQLLNLLSKNLEMNISYQDQTLIELKEKLLLQTIPRSIECFDISNIGSSYTVGAMVHFRDTKPFKNQYRKFKIKTVSGQNDFAMMAEIVKRRYSRLKKESLPMPDLILIDGGPGQLGAAFSELKKLELAIPIISLAKKEEIIHFIGEHRPLKLSRSSEALKILQQARDEAHRFGITYHRLLRSKGMLK